MEIPINKRERKGLIKVNEWEGQNISSSPNLRYKHEGYEYFLGRRFLLGSVKDAEKTFGYSTDDVKYEHKDIFFKSTEIKKSASLSDILSGFGIDFSFEGGEITKIDESFVTNIQDIFRLINLQNQIIQAGLVGGPLKKQGFSFLILKGTDGKFYQAEVFLQRPSAHEYRYNSKFGNIPLRWQIRVHYLGRYNSVPNNTRLLFPNTKSNG